MKIDLDHSAIKDLVAEGLLAQLTTEQRSEIIKQAVQSLLEPQKSHLYGDRGDSIFLAAFKDAANVACRQLLMEQANDPTSELRKVVGEQLQALFTSLGEPGSEFLSDLQRQIAHVVGEVLMKGWKQSTYDGDRWD